MNIRRIVENGNHMRIEGIVESGSLHKSNFNWGKAYDYGQLVTLTNNE